MEKNLFDEYLMGVHAKQYSGTDDDMPDDYQRWLENMDLETMMKYADDAIRATLIDQTK